MTLSATGLSVPGRVRDITFTLRPGQVTAIVGPNGAGKSTLLSALAGLTPGMVQLDGTPLSSMDPRARARAVGFLPQSGQVAWNVSVETLVSLGRLPHATGPAENAAAVDAALAALDLVPLRQRPLAHLSGGERGRAMLARVLAGQPRWILADEPLASLDLAHQHALLTRFRALARDERKGVVLVLHDLAQAMNHADHVVVLHHGRLAAEGPPELVLDSTLIQGVWGLSTRWLGEPGHRALQV